MESKHTPGPWRVVADPEAATSYIYADISYSVAQIYHNHEANARAVQEVPEMIEALRAAEKCMRYFQSTRNQPEVASIRAILARIDGAKP